MPSSVSSTNHSLFSRLRQETTDTNLHIVITDYLTSFDRELQLNILTDMFYEALDEEQHLHEAVVTAWFYLETNQIYLPTYPTINHYKNAIDFTNTLQPILTQTQDRTTQTVNAIATVKRNWNIDIPIDLPQDIRLPHLSKHLASSLAKISAIITFNAAIPLFRTAIQNKLSTSWTGRRIIPYLQKADVDRTIASFNQKLITTSMSMSQSVNVVIPTQTSTSATDTSIPGNIIDLSDNADTDYSETTDNDDQHKSDSDQMDIDDELPTRQSRSTGKTHTVINILI
jgi:hypothetical protein